MIKYIWIGPNGVNKEIGLVKRGDEVSVPKEIVEKFSDLGLIKEKQTKNSTTTQDKE